MAMKRILMILLVLALSAGIVSAQEGSDGGLSDAQEPSTWEGYDSGNMVVNEDGSVTVSSGGNPTVPTDYSGTVKVESGGAFTYGRRSYSGPGTCIISGSAPTVPPVGDTESAEEGEGTASTQQDNIECDFQEGAELDGVPVLGHASINDASGEITCTKCRIDGVESTGQSMFIFNPSGDPRIILKEGYLNLLDGFTGNIITTCRSGGPFVGAENLPSCAVVSQEGEYMHSVLGTIAVLGPGQYKSSGGLSRIIKPGEYAFTLPRAETLYQHNLECPAEPVSNCISLGEGPSLYTYITSGGVYLDYTEKFSLRQTTTVFSKNPDVAQLTVRQYSINPGTGELVTEGAVIFDPIKGIMRLGNYPPSLEAIEVTYPDGTQEKFVRENGVWKCLLCPSEGVASAQATSFFSFVGKAWVWITGRVAYTAETGPCTHTADYVEDNSVFPDWIDYTLALTLPDGSSIDLKVDEIYKKPVRFLNQEGKLVSGILIKSGEGRLYFVEVVVSPEGEKYARIYEKDDYYPGKPNYVGGTSGQQIAEIHSRLKFGPDEEGQRSKGLFALIVSQGSYIIPGSNMQEINSGVTVSLFIPGEGDRFVKVQEGPPFRTWKGEYKYVTFGGRTYIIQEVQVPGLPSGQVALFDVTDAAEAAFRKDMEKYRCSECNFLSGSNVAFSRTTTEISIEPEPEPPVTAYDPSTQNYQAYSNTQPLFEGHTNRYMNCDYHQNKYTCNPTGAFFGEERQNTFTLTMKNGQWELTYKGITKTCGPVLVSQQTMDRANAAGCRGGAQLTSNCKFEPISDQECIKLIYP